MAYVGLYEVRVDGPLEGPNTSASEPPPLPQDVTQDAALLVLQQSQDVMHPPLFASGKVLHPPRVIPLLRAAAAL